MRSLAISRLDVILALDERIEVLGHRACDREGNTLLAGCLKADKAAWDAFVLQYSALVYHTIKKTFGIYHTGPRTDQVEDLYQEFFVSILRDDFKSSANFEATKDAAWPAS